MNLQATLLLLAAAVVTLVLATLLIRLLNHRAKRTLIPLWVPWLLVAVAAGGASLYLHYAGTPVTVQVVQKKEEIESGRNGSWRRRLDVHVRHSASSTQSETFALSVDPPTFDSIHVGQPLAAKLWQPWDALQFLRLTEGSTFSWFRDLWHDTPVGPIVSGTAMVKQITPVTRFEVRGLNHDMDLRWPFDVVQLEFKPPNYADPIVAVDVIAAGTAAALAQGESIEIEWPMDDPRSAHIVGAQGGSRWKNLLYHAAFWIVLTIAVFAAFAVIKRRPKRRA